MTAAFVERQSVLVADDEEDVRFLLSRLLGDVGYEVHLAQDGLEALERIDATKPDLMILDLMMPGLDGWGVLKRLETHPSPPIVVLLTARGDPESFARGIRAGSQCAVAQGSSSRGASPAGGAMPRKRKAAGMSAARASTACVCFESFSPATFVATGR